MSYGAIKGIWFGKGKHTDTLIELENSHGTSPVIWNAMASKYLGQNNWMMAAMIGGGKRLWAIGSDKNVPKHQRAVFLFTMDRGYVLQKDYQRFAEDITKWLKDFPIPAGRVNHWPRILEFVSSDAASLPPAIGLMSTSLSDDLFEKPDWKKLWNVYEDLDAQ